MPALICGSLAFDTITTFPGRFAQQILPEQVHILNVSFLVPTLRREFGGCAGNIAYTLRQLGGEPLVLAAVGSDGQEYLQRLQSWGASTGETLESLSRSHLKGVIVTLGAQGCDLWQQGVRTHVPGVSATEVVDPTGCGDAFRAALLFGLERGWPLERCLALGNRVGALKIACRGGQNHRVDPSLLQG